MRVSRHPEDELIGSPHNIIRHPDMPRAAFRLLWDHLLRGRPIAAYVLDLRISMAKAQLDTATFFADELAVSGHGAEIAARRGASLGALLIPLRREVDGLLGALLRLGGDFAALATRRTGAVRHQESALRFSISHVAPPEAAAD